MDVRFCASSSSARRRSCLQAVTLKRRRNARAQQDGIEGFREIVHRALLDAARHAVYLVQRRDHYRRNPGQDRVPLDVLQHLDAVHLRHHHVQQDEIEIVQPQLLQGFLARGGGKDAVALAHELPGQEIAIHRVVVHHQQGSGVERPDRRLGARTQAVEDALETRPFRRLGRRRGGQCQLLHEREQFPRGSKLTFQIYRRALGAAGACEQLLRLLDQRRGRTEQLFVQASPYRVDVDVRGLGTGRQKAIDLLQQFLRRRHAAAGCRARAR